MKSKKYNKTYPSKKANVCIRGKIKKKNLPLLKRNFTAASYMTSKTLIQKERGLHLVVVKAQSHTLKGNLLLE